MTNKENENPLDRQVDGTHYKQMKIQPVEFNQLNQLNFCEASVVKYVCRHRNKNGKQDLLKAKHFIDLLLEIEYAELKPLPPDPELTKLLRPDND